MRVVIVGNGIAGISVAKELRTLGGADSGPEIMVIARESYDYYSRIRLPEVFGGGALGAELLALYKPGWYARNRIDVRLGREVQAIDREGRKVLMSSGEDIAFDALVLALGADPVRPEIRGAYLPGVFTVRDYDDAARVRRSVDRDPSSAVVVGGGLLGLEAARHLRDCGVASVLVLEAAPRLLPRQLDSGGAAVLAEEFRRMGIEVRTGIRLSGFGGEDRVESVILDDGSQLPASTVILSMGVRPRVGLARAAALETRRGIVVDDTLQTSCPGIFAVGDCAEHRGVSLGIIPAAMEQAPVCARSILGLRDAHYPGTVPSNTLKVAGIAVFSCGQVELEPGMDEYIPAAAAGTYERYLAKGGMLTGAIVMGSRERARAAQRAMGAPVPEWVVSG